MTTLGSNDPSNSAERWGGTTGGWRAATAAICWRVSTGTRLVPADFIAFANSHNAVNNQHKILLSNFLAQTEVRKAVTAQSSDGTNHRWHAAVTAQSNDSTKE